MKSSRIISILLTVVMTLTSLQLVSFAETESDCNHNNDEITIEFYGEISDSSKEKIISHFNGEIISDVHSRGLMCTLFGHKLETGTVSTITHKVRTSSPRCLKETFDYEVCSRCDEYSEYTLIGSQYIVCCS